MISFVVAIYNKEKYLKNCVDSILAQDYRDFEVLLIDDGSTDSSGKICDDYMSSDKRVRVFHTDNHGPGAARNIGIEEARGDYITFIDADDWIEPDFLSSVLVDCFDRYDVIFHRYIFEYDDGSKVYEFDYDIKEGNDLCGDIIRLNDKYFFESNCCKLIKRSLIIDNGIRYKTNLRKYEDWFFTYDFSRWMNSYLMVNTGNYHARYTGESVGHLSMNKFSLKQIHKIYRGITTHALRIPHDSKWNDFLYARLFIMIDGTLLYSDNIMENLVADQKHSFVEIARHYLKKADISLLGYGIADEIKYRIYYLFPFKWWFLLTYKVRCWHGGKQTR